MHQLSKAENRTAWKAYYQIRQKTSGRYPLKEGLKLDDELARFLGDTSRPIALVHVKNHVANATASPTDPRAYLPAIKWIKELGFLVVHVGRESMPLAFRELGVINYAESEIASYRHDLQIFAGASLAITAGSGIAIIADCMGTPLVYLDSWHVGMPLALARCVMVPARVQERQTGRWLTFNEQLKLYLALEDIGAKEFPSDRYVARNADADELLAAVKEALSMREGNVELSPLQQRYRDLDKDGLEILSLARASEFFLARHIDFLGRDDGSQNFALAAKNK